MARIDVFGLTDHLVPGRLSYLFGLRCPAIRILLFDFFYF